MKFKRIFSFGCSFTAYAWPTWSDIIAYDLELPYENWGLGGLGNFGIQARLVECDLKNNLETDDLVLLLWSGWNREDRFDISKGGWLCGGCIFHNPHYNEKYLYDYWTLENDIIRSITVIHSTRKAYKNIVKFEGEMTSPNHGDEYFNGQLEQYAQNVPIMLKLFDHNIPKFDIEKIDKWQEYLNDPHPSILQHLEFVEKYVYPKLDMSLKDKTKTDITNLHNKCFNVIEQYKDNKDKTNTYEQIKMLSVKQGLNFRRL